VASEERVESRLVIRCISTTMYVLMSQSFGARPVLLLVGGGGFAWEAKSLWLNLPHSVCWAFVIPDDSVTPEWTEVEFVHKLPAFSLRSEKSVFVRLWRSMNCLLKALALVNRMRPGLVICIGSAMALPVLLAARAFGAQSVFVESITRTNELSRTGQVVARFGLADLFLVQWPELADERRKIRFEGTVL